MTEIFDNIWDALLDDPADRESCKIKSELMINVELFIKERSLTQGEAAELMGVSQPKISNIVNGRMDRITVDSLINMLAKVGITFDLKVSNSDENIEEESHNEIVLKINQCSDDYEWRDNPIIISPNAETLEKFSQETKAYECASAA